MVYEEQLKSSWLSSEGELLNLTWNDTSREIKSGPIMEWDDAAWVLSATFIIFNMQTGSYNWFHDKFHNMNLFNCIHGSYHNVP